MTKKTKLFFTISITAIVAMLAMSCRFIGSVASLVSGEAAAEREQRQRAGIIDTLTGGGVSGILAGITGGGNDDAAKQLADAMDDAFKLFKEKTGNIHKAFLCNITPGDGSNIYKTEEYSDGSDRGTRRVFERSEIKNLQDTVYVCFESDPGFQNVNKYKPFTYEYTDTQRESSSTETATHWVNTFLHPSGVVPTGNLSPYGSPPYATSNVVSPSGKVIYECSLIGVYFTSADKKKEITDALKNEYVWVMLDTAVSSPDANGRLPVYILQNKDNVERGTLNQVILNSGYAQYSGNNGSGSKAADIFKASESFAKAEQLGIWKPSNNLVRQAGN